MTILACSQLGHAFKSCFLHSRTSSIAIATSTAGRGGIGASIAIAVHHHYSSSASSLYAKKKIVFLGTPDVAALSLKILHNERNKYVSEENEYEIVSVVTQPPAPAGRKRKLTPSDVQVMAEKLELPNILTPVKAGEADFIEKLTSLQPDLCITAAYGNFLPTKFLNIPKYGTLNIHPSLLPLYRGAAPLPRCLENGDKVTGVSVLFTVLKMDAGPIVKKVIRDLDGDEKCTELLPELFETGTRALIDVLPSLWDGTIEKIEQHEEEVTHAAKMTTEEARIDFQTMSAIEIHNRCRGFSVWPGTWSLFQIGEGVEPVRVKIITTKVLKVGGRTDDNSENDSKAVEYITEGKIGIFKVKCFDGSELGIVELQPPGKKTMTANAYQNGLKGLGLTLFWADNPPAVAVVG